MSNRPGGYDLIVVGLGAMGAATLLQARRRGLNVLGIDRYDPPHDYGSSHAETRVTRLAVGEGEQYLPFAKRSHEIWRELEAATGEELFYENGNLIINPMAQSEDERWGDFVHATATVAGGAGLDFETLTAAELRDRYQRLLVRDDEHGGFEPTGGAVMCERAVEVQLRLARLAGADTRVGELVVDIDTGASAVTVRTNRDVYNADRVVIATGAWVPHMVGSADRSLLTVTRQVVYWFEVDEPDDFAATHFPTVIWASTTVEDYLAVFPIPTRAAPVLKVLGEQFATTTDADAVDRWVSQAEIDSFYERVVAPRVAGVRPACVRSTVCLYTNTPDDHFLIDTDPGSDRVMFVSPCSGHGFKHSAAIGEAIAETVAEGASTHSLEPFTRGRFTG